MSYNQGSMKTEYVDPNVFVPGAAGRAIFELDGTKMGYSPNMRLLNLGAVSDGAHDYNRLLGAVACIRNIRLLDGRTELSALRSPAQYLAFKAQQRTNSDNKSSASWLKRSVIGYEIDQQNRKLNHIFMPGTLNTAEGTTSSAYLDLREVFPILNSMPIIPTSVFPNLKIEIEFGANTLNQVSVNQTTATTAAQSILRPILAVDYVDDERIMMPLMRALRDNGVRWNEIEHDRTHVAGADGAAAGTKQNNNKQSMGFVGKRVERLLITKQLVDQQQTVIANEVAGYGNVASQAMLKQTTQVRLNGKNVFPGFEGISKPMERLGLISDEYGACQAYPGSAHYRWSNANILMKQGTSGGAAVVDSGKAFSGALSYDVCRIGARVADLQIQIGREFDASPANAAQSPSATNLALNINIFAEVDKAMAITKDGYRIVYV